MKKIFYLFTLVLVTFSAMAQNNNSITPQVNVNGEGSVKIKPDYAVITMGAEIKDLDSAKAKKQNDEIIAKMIQVIKKSAIAEKDYQTQRVNLYKTREYQEKKDYFVASQTITITLRSLDNYEKLMADLMAAGANTINGVEFKSTQTEKVATEIRAKAVLNAKKKAEDYASALNQSIGKALIINDQSMVNNPRVYMMKTAMADESAGMDQTLAVGEIEISTNVNVVFELK